MTCCQYWCFPTSLLETHPFVHPSFFSAFSDVQSKAKEGEVDHGEMRWVTWVGACYYKLLPMLLISYSRRAVLPPQMKAAVVSDREWP